MTVGRDAYCDTRLIINILEKRFPSSSKYTSICNSDIEPMRTLLEKFTIDAGVFSRAAQLLPTSLPLMKDPKFTKDREDFMGRSWAIEDIEKQRPEALAHMRKIFDTMESILHDGRKWIASTDKASLADIECKIRVFETDRAGLTLRS